MACDAQSLFNGQEFLWPDTPPLYVPRTLHHHPPPLHHPPHSGIGLLLSNGRQYSSLPSLIQFAPVMRDRYLMDKNYYGYPPPPLRGVSYLGKEARL